MSTVITHHPEGATLMSYAAATLTEPLAAVVAVQLAAAEAGSAPIRSRTRTRSVSLPSATRCNRSPYSAACDPFRQAAHSCRASVTNRRPRCSKSWNWS